MSNWYSKFPPRKKVGSVFLLIFIIDLSFDFILDEFDKSFFRQLISSAFFALFLTLVLEWGNFLSLFRKEKTNQSKEDEKGADS